MTKLKIGALVALVSSVLLNIWLLTRPKSTPETLIVEKEVVKEVIVEKAVKEQTKVVTTKPDGTVIVRETKKDSETVEKTQESKKESSTLIAHAKPKYSLGVQVGRPLGLDILNVKNIYQIEVGYRLGGSPIWATMAYSTERSVLAGFRLEF